MGQDPLPTDVQPVRAICSEGLCGEGEGPASGKKKNCHRSVKVSIWGRSDVTEWGRGAPSPHNSPRDTWHCLRLFYRDLMLNVEEGGSRVTSVRGTLESKAGVPGGCHRAVKEGHWEETTKREPPGHRCAVGKGSGQDGGPRGEGRASLCP